MIPELTTVCRLLEEDTLRNLVTLKMLHCYPSGMSFQLEQGADGWALLSLLEVRHSEWDRKTYPACTYAAFINGTSAQRKLQCLAKLPNEPLVLKIADDVIRERLVQNEMAAKARTFHSFTSGRASSPAKSDSVLGPSARYDERAWAMFRANGYEDEELARYFQAGALWFGIEQERQLASACFIFQNYKQIWEIGGVYTESTLRRRGLGQKVVCAALRHLTASGLVPRYQTTEDNQASLALAKACGLREFLQMDHYLIRNDALSGSTHAWR